MTLKFKHQWESGGWGKRTLLTTLDISAVQFASEAELAVAQTPQSLLKHVEAQNEERLRREIYDLPRGEFNRALQDLLVNVTPVTHRGFEAARRKLEAMATQLNKPL